MHSAKPVHGWTSYVRVLRFCYLATSLTHKIANASYVRHTDTRVTRSKLPFTICLPSPPSYFPFYITSYFSISMCDCVSKG